MPLIAKLHREAVVFRYRETQRCACPNRRVLIVDDNTDAADALAELLRLHGIEVATAYGGVEALEKQDSWQPCIVVLDLNMPVVDGFEVARQLDRRPRRSVLVALSARGDLSTREGARTAGFDVQFVKPADWDTLAAFLREVLPD